MDILGLQACGEITRRRASCVCLWFLLSGLGLSLAAAEITVTSHDFTGPVFPWQPSAASQKLDGSLRIVGCAGEYEPVAFTLHSEAKQGVITLAVSGLEGFDFELFWVKSLHRKSLGEAAFINQLPGIPDAWKGRSPELLMAFSDERPNLVPGLGQRFYVDCRIPDGQKPGMYHGTVTVLAGERQLLQIPLEVEVLPFALSSAPSSYWMWRLTWTPIDRPENLACLRDIKAHGYTGLARKFGASFAISFDAAGRIHVAPGTMPAFAKALHDTGLAPSFADDGIANQLFAAIAKHLALPVTSAPEQLPSLEEAVFTKLKREHTAAQAKAGLDKAALEDDPTPDLTLDDQPEADPDAAFRREATRQAAELQAKVRTLAIDGFHQVKGIAADLGLKLRVFPIDEPCGTPWQRRWTSYAAGLAREAGLATFSTRNNWDWDANLDEGAAGGMINAMYQASQLVTAPYEGGLAFPALPWIGAFRGGEKYHFRGLIDEVRIYNRALTDDEIRRQHEQPAPGPLAYFPCDGPAENARLSGKPGFVSEGKVGGALQVNGVDQHLEPVVPDEPVDLSGGWAISLWYRGSGSLFGRGYDFYQDELNGALRYTTTGPQKVWFRYGGHQSERFWCHLTLSFDPKTHRIAAFCEDAEMRRWHRENIAWNYVQVRSFPPRNPRFKTGIMSWWYANHGALTNVTTFCYDWNAAHLYVVYPKNGDRFKNDGVWYRTLGWEGCREGIDDARYLQTLVDTFVARGATKAEAVARIDRLLAPVDISYASIAQVDATFGSYLAFRRKLITEILANQ